MKPQVQNNVRGTAATASGNGARPGKIRSVDLAKGLMARVLHPRHLWTAAKLHRQRRAHRKSADDAVLALYASILPDGFLHYGYFDDLTGRPEDMPYAELGRAQLRYAKLLLEYVVDAAHPVLDAGCGMGGLCRMLVERGFDPVALTPDRTQGAHIAQSLPQVPLVRSKLEDISKSEYAGRFGTVITAESLQYMKLDRALPVLAAVLKPGGRWIMSDYYRLSPQGDRSCHCWSEFRQRVADDGWRFVAERDITANVMPSLAFVHMWVSRLAIPAMQMGVSRLRRRQPGLHHLLGDVLKLLEGVVHENFQRIDPHWFAANRCYMVGVLEKP